MRRSCESDDRVGERLARSLDCLSSAAERLPFDEEDRRPELTKLLGSPGDMTRVRLENDQLLLVSVGGSSSERVGRRWSPAEEYEAEPVEEELEPRPMGLRILFVHDRRRELAPLRRRSSSSSSRSSSSNVSSSSSSLSETAVAASLRRSRLTVRSPPGPSVAVEMRSAPVELRRGWRGSGRGANLIRRALPMEVPAASVAPDCGATAAPPTMSRGALVADAEPVLDGGGDGWGAVMDESRERSEVGGDKAGSTGSML